MTRKHHDVDRGWAWLVLIAVYFGIFMLSTSLYTAGVMYVALLDYYHEDAAKTSIIGALNNGLLCLMAPVSALISDKFSCRTSMLIGSVTLTLSYVISAFMESVNWLIVVAGLFGGIGNAFIGSPFVVVLAFYFEKRRDFFIAFSTAIVGVAMNAASPLALYLLETYGLKGTFLLTGGLCAHLFIVSVICRPSSLELELQVQRDKNKHIPSTIDLTFVNSSNLSLKSISKTLRPSASKVIKFFKSDSNIFTLPFITFLLSTMTWNFMLSACLMHIPNYTVTKGLTNSSIAIIMTVFSSANTLGRFLGAMTLNQEKINSMLLHALSLCFGGVLTLLFPYYSHKYLGAYIFAGLAGMFTGVPNSLMTSISIKLVGLDRLSSAHGLELFFCGIGVISGPPLTGYLYERTMSYENSFILSASVLLAGSVLAFVTYCRSARCGKADQQSTIKQEEELQMIDDTYIHTPQ